VPVLHGSAEAAEAIGCQLIGRDQHEIRTSRALGPAGQKTAGDEQTDPADDRP
jgi:hypothetical protein